MTSERKGSRASAKTVLVVPDLHFPYHHRDAFRFLADVKKRFRPDRVVMIGDLLDMHTLSRFIREVDSMGTCDELYAARDCVKRLAKIFPTMTVTMGNHDMRFARRAQDAGLPAEFLRPFHDVVGAPRTWQFVEEFELDGVLYFHGDGFGGQNPCLSAIRSKLQSCIFGHTHRASLFYQNNLWAMNVGCLVDQGSLAMRYGKHFPVKPWLGCGLIENGVPRLQPLS